MLEDNRNILDTADPDSNHYADNIINFNSYTPESLCGKINTKGTLNIFHQNVHSILKDGRKEDIDIMLDTINNPFHILAFTETWLKLDNLGTVKFKDYEHIYKIRPMDNHFDMKERGGGLSIFIKKHIQYKEREDLNVMLPFIETLFIEVPHKNKTYLIGVIYRIPGTNIKQFNDKLNSLIEPIRNNYDIVLVGDFNICLLKDNNHTQSFRNCMQANSLFPTILEATRVANVLRNGNNQVTQTLIDNIFINDKLNHKSGLIYSSISDHYPIFLSICNESLNFQDNTKLIHYRLIDDVRIRKFKSALHISFINSISTLNNASEAFSKFYLTFNELYDKYFPIVSKVATKKAILHPWITECLVKRIKIKENLCKLSLKGRIDRDTYTRFRNKLTTFIRKAKAEYHDKEFVKCEGDVKKTWKLINDTIKNKLKNNNITIKEDNHTIEEKETPNTFNNYFSNIPQELVSNIPPVDTNFTTYLKNRTSNSFYMSNITYKEIDDAIEGLKLNGGGVNKISTSLLKEVKSIIINPLIHTFNLCLSQGYFPSELKLGCITPIFKKGDKSSISNYRPVCSLSPFSKIFERIVYNRMVDFITKYNIFAETQYGFRKNKSTESALLDFTNYIHEGLTKNLNVGAVFMDLSKAFDVINHSIIETKLEHYGFRGIFLTFLMNFIKERKYFVSVNGLKSGINTVNIGVPQGSTLGPLLFLLYINDMKNCSKILKFIQFADDTTLLFSSKCIQHLTNKLGTEANKVFIWLAANKLIINLTKTHSMLFTNKRGNLKLSLQIQNIDLEDKKETSFLGVIIDNKLSWKQHIQHITNKISKSTAILRLLRHKFPKRILKMLYMSLIFSYINYCNLIWGSAYKTILDPLFLLQKKAVRIINNSEYLAHTDPIFKSLKILDVYKVFKLNCLLFAYKCLRTAQYPEFKRKIHKNSSIHSYETRINDLYRPPKERLDLCQRSYLYQSVILWNTICMEIKYYNCIITFKKKVKALILENMI